MDFTENLHRAIAPLAATIEESENARAWEEAIIAQFSPHLLRRFAEIAAAFDVPGLRAGRGEILACRSGPEGYRMVEYDAPDLRISLEITGGEARLRWRAGDATDDRRITLDTPEAAIDAILLDAVSAFVGWRTARAPV